MQLQVTLTLVKVGTCYIKTEYLNDFIKGVQDSGFYVVITETDGEPVDVENNELFSDEYTITVFKMNTD